METAICPPNLDNLHIWRMGKMLSLQVNSLVIRQFVGLHKLKVQGWIWFCAQMDSRLKYYNQDTIFFFSFQLVLSSPVSSPTQRHWQHTPLTYSGTQE